jgi:DNA-binding response OmpR family regulator
MTYHPRKRILIIDDDMTMNAIVGGYLQAAGYEVHSASNPEQAITNVRVVRPHAIVLDRYLGRKDGADLLVAIRNIPGFEGIPVLMLTGETRKDEVRKAINAGVNGYLAKPFAPEELLRKIEKLLKGP